MSTFSLTNTGSEIDSAIGKVHGADTTPTSGSTDMVTSGGVYTAINNLSLANLAGSALVTESEGIANNDNDTTIPTSAAVKDYVDNQSLLSVSTLTKASTFTTSSSSFVNVTGVSASGPYITSNGDNTFTIAAGAYLVGGTATTSGTGVGFDGEFNFTVGSGTFGLDSSITSAGTNLSVNRIGFGGLKQMLYFSSPATILLRLKRDGGTTWSVSNINISLIKLG
jgi:hypothetical protein